MGKDTGLPVLGRSDAEGITSWIANGASVKLDLPDQAIEGWERQYSSETLAVARLLIPLTENFPIDPFRKRAGQQSECCWVVVDGMQSALIYFPKLGLTLATATPLALSCYAELLVRVAAVGLFRRIGRLAR